ncbi:hypothetical protein CsSME_00039563 [Camellia sinensis var. sinensis]
MGGAPANLRCPPLRHRILGLRRRRDPKADLLHPPPPPLHRSPLQTEIPRPQTPIHSPNRRRILQRQRRRCSLARGSQENPSRRAQTRTRTLRSLHLVKSPSISGFSRCVFIDEYISEPELFVFRSLQSKVKRLEEEREESLREDENGGEKSDLERKSDERESEEEEKIEQHTEPEKSSPEPSAGEESDRKPDQTGEPNGPGVSGGSSKPVGENSCNGSSDSIEKEPVRESVKAEPEGGVSDSPGLLESVAESKGGGVGEESSDVQSSASRSRKEGGGGSDKVRCRTISGDEPENEDQSPTVKRKSNKSLPLVDFLETVRSHKLGSVFERRDESQETTPKYRNLIRQHIDLETMQTRLEEGWYSGCHIKFFRDLLLLLNNAVLFYGKKSRESASVIELRKLITKEMNQRSLKLDSSSEEQPPSLPPASLAPKPEPELSDSLLLKQKLPGPSACRTRSSLTAKATGSSLAADKKREQKAALLEEKPILDWKQSKSSGNAEEHRVTKRRTRDWFGSGSRSSNKNGTSHSNANPNKNSEARSSQNQGKGASSSEHSEPKSENTNAMSGAKKRSAANFLNRMKRSSSTNNGSLPDSLKSSAVSSNNNNKGGGAEQRRGGNGKAEIRKEQSSRRGSGGKQQAKEQASAAKRSIGRPPKRAAAPPPSTPAPVSGKRGREGGDTETSRKPKKRSRR